MTIGAVRFIAAVLVLIAAPAFAAEQSFPIGTANTMAATLYTPDGPGPYPAVLVLHTSGGLQPDDTAYARRLTEAGYVTVVPRFLDAYNIRAASRAQTFTTYADRIFADFVDGIARLKAQEKVKGSKVGSVGFSNGGYFALWLAGAGKIDAGVSYYGALTGAATDPKLDRLRGALTATSAPVLLLHGTSDGTVRFEFAQVLAGHGEGPARGPVLSGRRSPLRPRVPGCRRPRRLGPDPGLSRQVSEIKA